MAPLHVIVIGSGVAGLSCARLLQEAGHRVEICARERPPRTTSNVAAAFWYPYRVSPADRVHAWARASFAAFERLLPIAEAGILRREALELLAGPVEPSWAALLPKSRPARSDELPAGHRFGQIFESLVVETPRYIPWLCDAFLAAGGTLVERALGGIDEALAAADAVFLCAGLGARELAPDPSVSPVRGQILRVRNPGLDRVIVDEHGEGAITYVVPRAQDVILGGTSDEGDERLAADPAATAAILERCVALEPRLRDAPLLEVLVGLRPCRPTVRVEREERGGTPLIHNYGHGGAGITLSWGCAAEAVGLL